MVTVFVLFGILYNIKMGVRFPATGWDSIVRVYAEAQCTVTPSDGQQLKSQIILKQITYRELHQGSTK